MTRGAQRHPDRSRGAPTWRLMVEQLDTKGVIQFPVGCQGLVHEHESAPASRAQTNIDVLVVEIRGRRIPLPEAHRFA